MTNNENVHFITKKEMEMYLAAQANIPHHYNTDDYFGQCSLVVEQQSEYLLKKYAEGKFELSPEAMELMDDYLHILTHSEYAGIKKHLKEAVKKFSHAQKQAKLEAIQKHKDEEKKANFIASHFSILDNKKVMAKLSSHDMLLLSDALESETRYSTKRMKDKMRSYAMLRAEKVIKGEMTADDGFAELTRRYGSYQQKNFVQTRLTKKDEQISNQEDTPVITPKKKKSWVNRALKAAKRAVVVAGIAVVSLIGGKALFNTLSCDVAKGMPEKDKQETTFTPKKQVVVTPVEQQKTTTEKQDSVSPEFQKVLDNLNKAYKDRFDSALEIHLGTEKRDQLYQQIDKLAQDGKIEYKDGTTREWYAHAFTMYAKIAPNSDGKKLIDDLLAGNNVDKTQINDLVVNAKRDGTGISGTGSYSAFDNAPQEVQKKHINNRRNVRSLEKLMQKSR